MQLDGERGAGTYDGTLKAGHLGVDAKGDGWLAGLSVSRSAAELDYHFDGGVEGRGVLETTLTGVHPYALVGLGATELWLVGGLAGGEARLTREHTGGGWQRADLSMAMVAAGMKRPLTLDVAGAGIALKGDAGLLRLETDGGAAPLTGLAVDVSRLRVGLEAAWQARGALVPFAEIGGRLDGGDGETGAGLEVAGGVRIDNAVSGLGLEAKGRVLALHSAEERRERGVSVTASYAPGTAGRGVSFRVSPRWGHSADATDRLWSDARAARHSGAGGRHTDAYADWGMDAVLGYGFNVPSLRGLIVPFSRLDLAGDAGRRLRAGVRYARADGARRMARLELSAERAGGIHEGSRRHTRLLFSAQARF
ncbi:MAG: hypothetical protein F4Y01_12205 [Gammaproteobacteria bacterium]|nr:hypothetical protein [Gammaproteobacteria bacterium]